MNLIRFSPLDHIMEDINGSRVYRLGADDVLFFPDNFDQERLRAVVSTAGAPGAVITSVESTLVEQSVPLFYVPLMDVGVLRYLFWFRDYQFDDQIDTRCCFSFSVAKKTLDRHLMLKMIEWFDLNDYCHTWSGHAQSDMSYFLSEMNQLSTSWCTDQFRRFVLAPVSKIQPRWLPAPGAVPDSLNITDIQLVPERSVVCWEDIAAPITRPAAVTMITESTTGMQKNYTLTEKTMYSVLALSFPLWIGSTYGQADVMKALGFDVFEDVIDHSYQYLPTVMERTYHAIHSNLPLLTDRDLAHDARQSNHARLLKNRDWALTGFRSRAMDQIADLPPGVRDCVHAYQTMFPRESIDVL